MDEAETFRQTIWKRDPEGRLTQALTPERARQSGQLRVECADGILPANRVRKVHRPCIAERWHEAERAAREYRRRAGRLVEHGLNRVRRL